MRTPLLLACILLMPGGSLIAATGTGGFPIGPMEAYPILQVGAGYAGDLLSEDGVETNSSPVVFFSFGGGIQGERRGHVYGVEYEGSSGWYTDSSVDDYFDQRVTAYWGTAFTIRHHVDLGIEYTDAHDPRGELDVISGARDNLSRDPDEWHTTQYGGTYTFGAPGARGRLDLQACQTCLRYDNNDQGFRDRDITDFGATVYARVSPKTSILAGVSHADFDYTDERPDDVATLGSQNSTELRYYGGLAWDATARTSGEVRVGRLEKDFDDSKRQDYDDIFWTVDLSWAPRSYSTVNMGYSRFLYETVVIDDRPEDDYVQVQEVDVSWDHAWGPRVSSQLSAYRGWDDWEPSGRSDDRFGYSAGLTYVINKWASLGVGYSYRQRDAEDPRYDYDDSEIWLTLSVGVAGRLGWGSRAPGICSLR